MKAGEVGRVRVGVAGWGDWAIAKKARVARARPASREVGWSVIGFMGREEWS
jgi:hypothetical protein